MKEWNLENIPSPCYVLSERLLIENLKIVDMVRRQSGAEVIVALKANAMWSIFDILAEHSDGATASSLAEAELVREKFGAGGAQSHTYAPVYTESEIGRILELSSHITFNSLNQYKRYGARAVEAGVSCGLRMNIGYSPVETDIYNPCVAGSRLGITDEEMVADGYYDTLPEGVEGLHFHVLCESRPHHLRLALEALEARFGALLPSLKWLNMGGGHLLTHKDYDVDELIAIIKEFKGRYPHLRLILEPGSAFTWCTGDLVTTVEDVVSNGGVTTAIINASFACHMPDCLEMPYQPAIIGAHDVDSGGWRVGGNSCLAGDFMGEWVMNDGHLPAVGERLIFEDMIHYTMVKTTMFNGVSHPSIAIQRCDGGVEIVKKFGYEDYRNRMS